MLVARTVSERRAGLSGLDGLADGQGMLFVYDPPQVAVFGIKDVTFPIEVVFIAENGMVSSIEPLDPGDVDRRVTSPAAVDYVLEVPQGWCEINGVSVGSMFSR